MIIPDLFPSVNPFSQTFSKTLRISMIITKQGRSPFPFYRLRRYALLSSPSAEGKRFRRSGGLCRRRRSLFYRLLTVYLPPIQRCAAGSKIYALGGRGHWPPSAAGECRCPPARTRGDVGHLRFPMSPLDTPLTFREPRRPAVARLNGGYEGSVPGVEYII